MRLVVVDTGPTLLGDLYGPPEELEAYVLGALARGEPVDPTFIVLVNQWRDNNDRPPLGATELRAKTGEKTGAGGHPQHYGEHGKYAKAGVSSTATATKPMIEPLTAPSSAAQVSSAIDADVRTAAGVPPLPNPFEASQAAKSIVQRDLAAGLVERAKTDPDLAAGLKAEVAELGVVGAGYVGFRLHVDEAAARWLLRNAADEGGVELGARLSAQRYIDQWAVTSSDSDPHALAAQKIAAGRFGLDSSWVDDKVKTLREKTGKAGAIRFGQLGGAATYDTDIAEGPRRTITESILDVQYANTQATLKKAGIKELTLARGVETPVRRGAGPVSYQLSPMSSWSSDKSVANDFALTNVKDRPGSTLVARVPVSRVISTFATGAGCLPESEYIVLGSPQPETILAEPPGDPYAN